MIIICCRKLHVKLYEDDLTTEQRKVPADMI